MNNKKNNNNKGTTLVEALIAIAIVSFVVVSILGGISHQQMSSRNISGKNTAILLGEMRMEQLMKFPSGQLAIETYTDYIVRKANGFEIFDTNPNKSNQFKRTTDIKKDLVAQVATIEVLVEYGRKAGDVYPYKIKLISRRGAK